MKYTATSGSERAHIYRDRLRSVELAHVQREAAQLAGDEVDKAELDELEAKAGALRDKAEQAENEKAGQ